MERDGNWEYAAQWTYESRAEGEGALRAFLGAMLTVALWFFQSEGKEADEVNVDNKNPEWHQTSWQEANSIGEEEEEEW